MAKHCKAVSVSDIMLENSDLLLLSSHAGNTISSVSLIPWQPASNSNPSPWNPRWTDDAVKSCIQITNRKYDGQLSNESLQQHRANISLYAQHHWWQNPPHQRHVSVPCSRPLLSVNNRKEYATSAAYRGPCSFLSFFQLLLFINLSIQKYWCLQLNAACPLWKTVYHALKSYLHNKLSPFTDKLCTEVDYETSVLLFSPVCSWPACRLQTAACGMQPQAEEPHFPETDKQSMFTTKLTHKANGNCNTHQYQSTKRFQILWRSWTALPAASCPFKYSGKVSVMCSQVMHVQLGLIS